MIDRHVGDFKYRMYEAHLHGIFNKHSEISSKDKLYMLVKEYTVYKQNKENCFQKRIDISQYYIATSKEAKEGGILFYIDKDLFYSPDIDELIKKMRLCRSLTYGLKSKIRQRPV